MATTSSFDIYAQVVEGLGSGVLATDAEGRVLACNPAAQQFLGLPPDLRGADIHLVESLRPFAALFEEICRQKNPILRRELFLKEGPEMQREIGVSASLLDGPLPFNGVIFLFTDMTDRRLLERSAEVNRQLASLGELTAGVVHELRNPLSVISGMAELLMRRLEPGEKTYRSAETIWREAQDLDRAISQFLGFARPFELHRADTSPKAILERVRQLCDQNARQKRVELHVGQENLDLRLRVDPLKMAQAIANIVGNAVDLLGDGGEIWVDVAHRDEMLLFKVMDNGPGVQVEANENIFSPFFSKKRGGTGLGLAIVHRIVTAHGGTVTYRNHESGGAIFEIRIPLNLNS
jgi:signal transduction histidine kinase